METSRRRTDSVEVTKNAQRGVRHRSKVALPQCESLEGRALLSSFGVFRASTGATGSSEVVHDQRFGRDSVNTGISGRLTGGVRLLDRGARLGHGRALGLRLHDTSASTGGTTTAALTATPSNNPMIPTTAAVTATPSNNPMIPATTGGTTTASATTTTSSTSGTTTTTSAPTTTPITPPSATLTMSTATPTSTATSTTTTAATTSSSPGSDWGGFGPTSFAPLFGGGQSNFAWGGITGSVTGSMGSKGNSPDFSKAGWQGFGGGAPTQGNSSSTQGTTTSSSTGNSQLKTDFQKLQTDLQAIDAKSQVTVAETTALRADFQKIQAAATSKPDQTKLSTLKSDITALNGQLPSASQTTQLTTDLTAVLTSAGITDQSLIQQTITDIQAIEQSSGVTSTDVSTIAADRKAIAADTSSSAPSGSTSGSTTTTAAAPATATDPLGWPALGGIPGNQFGGGPRNA